MALETRLSGIQLTCYSHQAVKGNQDPVTFDGPGTAVTIQDDFYYLDQDAVDKSAETSSTKTQRTLCIDDEDGDEDIPFALECMVVESHNNIDRVRNDHHDNDYEPFATAEEGPLSSSMLPSSLCLQYSVPAHPLPENPSTSTSFPRPEFLFVSAIKPTAPTPVGLTFKKKNGAICITHVKPNSLFARSGLQAGDEVIAVNHIDCTDVSLRHMPRIIQTAKSTVCFCVRNKGGDPHCVLSSVQKPTRSSKLGVCFQMRRGALTISAVHENSLFAGSLLMSNHRCFVINGQFCDNKGAQAAADQTAGLDRVTIISRARDDMATVLSVAGTRKLRLKSPRSWWVVGACLPLPQKLIWRRRA